ncbi:hypothetical protein [Tenuifilum osseticum]|uniref:hypothetical protein n=1 Tax=Tenuifilum osseticum TaxID=3374723 RepID=UPI0034E4EC9A
MKGSKLVHFSLFILAIFVVSVIFTIIDNGTYTSAFEAGKATGQTMRHFLKISFTLGLIVLMYRLFKKNAHK